MGLASAEGIVIGAHRGFSHNSFKLTTWGQVLVIILQTLSGQVGTINQIKFSTKRIYIIDNGHWILVPHSLVGTGSQIAPQIR